MDDGGWTLVDRRRHRKKESCSPISLHSFFFRNFPESSTASDLRRLFSRAEVVEDIFIPTKRDKRGKRFGFVRLSGIKDVNTTLKILNSSWIGSFVIRALVPKFQRPEPRRRNSQPPIKNTQDNSRVFSPALKKISPSYAAVVRQTQARDRSSRQPPPPTKPKQVSSHDFTTYPEEKEWLQGAYTGRLKDDFLWKYHGEDILTECSGILKITDMGDRLILLQSATGNSVISAIEGLDEWAHYWLDWWRPWSCRDINTRRFVWSKWTDVPLHAGLEGLLFGWKDGGYTLIGVKMPIVAKRARCSRK